MRKAVIVAVVGGKSSGKTTATETLTRELTKRGYRIAAVKHIPESDFTIDSVGKDTWRFAQSGARTIVSVAPNEITTIEKMDTKGFSVREVLKRCKGNDAIFLEGFRKLVGKDDAVLKIVAVKSFKEASEAIKSFKPILAFTGSYSTKNLNAKIPYVDVLKSPEEIADVVEKVVKKKNEN